MNIMSHSWMMVKMQGLNIVLEVMMGEWRIKVLVLIIRPIMMCVIVLVTMFNIILVPCMITPIYLEWRVPRMRLLISSHWQWHLSTILLLLLPSSFHFLFLHLKSLLLKL